MSPGGAGSLATNITGIDKITVLDAVTGNKPTTLTLAPYATALTIDASALDATDAALTIAGGNLAASLTYTGGAGADIVTGGGTQGDNISGEQNIGLGYDALTNVQSGDGNIGIGYEAGSVLVTGNNNIVIGKDAEVNATSSTNEIVIGYNATGNGSNTVTIGANKLGFTCALDNNATTHTYPRATDPAHNTALAITAADTRAGTITVNVGTTAGSGTAYPRSTDAISGKWIQVSNVATDTFDIQVLDTIPSTNTNAHTFVSSVTNAIKQLSLIHI